MGRLQKIQSAIGRVFGVVACAPFFFTKAKVAPPDFNQKGWLDALVDDFNKPGMRVLEIGSRVVTGANYRSRFDQAEYVGFDYMDGENVDVVGDIHRLSSCFDKPFDLVFCCAVFEHVAMPWIAAEEIAKVLKVGGRAMIATHCSFNIHERPWHFFQFSDNGLHLLFNDALGFKLLTKGVHGRIAGYHMMTPRRRFRPILELYAFSTIYVEKAFDAEIDWRTVNVNQLVGGEYPLINNGPKASKAR